MNGYCGEQHLITQTAVDIGGGGHDRSYFSLPSEEDKHILLFIFPLCRGNTSLPFPLVGQENLEATDIPSSDLLAV